MTLPDHIVIDGDGFGWRVWDDTDYWSMVPTNPDNSPVPRPLTYYIKEVDVVALQSENRRLRGALDDIIATPEQPYIDVAYLRSIARAALQIADGSGLPFQGASAPYFAGTGVTIGPGPSVSPEEQT